MMLMERLFMGISQEFLDLSCTGIRGITGLSGDSVNLDVKNFGDAFGHLR